MQKVRKLDRAPKLDLSDFKDKNGNWKDENRWPTHAVMVICRTTGCPAESVVHDLALPVNVDGELRVMCAGCHMQPETFARTA